MRVRVGIGFDAHRLVAGRALTLGGETVDYARGLAGHSDGDVVIHAITDALLGAVAAPDIGALFPSSDPRWKGASSRVFLEKARSVVEEKGYRVQQIDVVVIAEAPRLSPHVTAMRQRLADYLGLPIDDVGVKATSTDGMGYTGKGEGIAAQAVVTVVA